MINDLFAGLTRHADRPAFCIHDKIYSYGEFSSIVASIRALIRTHIAKEDRIVGLLADDHLNTYASILALWAEGKGYVPLAPGAPAARTEQIVSQSGIRALLAPGPIVPMASVEVFDTLEAPTGERQQPCSPITPEHIAYLLFTSGTTGKPKGVPITHGALSAFISAFDALGLDVVPEDRVLQMFDLTFDLSVMSYLIPLLNGACVYTIPGDVLKYTYIHGLLEDHGITVALMVPSILNYLRPYFDEVDCPSLRASLFCGEALPLEVVCEWSKCAPQARIINVYGPTEHTIFCTAYEFHRKGPNKSSHGILSIGKAMLGTTVGLLDEQGNWKRTGPNGELTLAGPQATFGYWQDPERNSIAFVRTEGPAGMRHYRTGDRCAIDEEGDILYLGRTDHQVKIQGYRVELAEVEHHARSVLPGSILVAVAVMNTLGNSELVLVVEGRLTEPREVLTALRAMVPAYMVPSRIMEIERLPLNANGKIDRPALVARFSAHIP